MNRRQQSLVALAALVFGALIMAGCGSSTDTPDNTVAATVNGKKIMMSEVERIIHQQSQGNESKMSPHELAQARLTVLDKLIQREVLFQRAEQEKLLPTEEQITSAINQQKQQAGYTDEDFARQLKDQNMSMEAVREESKKDLAINSLQDKYSGKITISDREVEDYYNNNKPQFVNARGVGLAMIMVDPADNSQQGVAGDDAKNETDAKTKIDNINAQLKSGADFATVARARSEDPQSVRNGGDIGFATEEDLKNNGFPTDLVAKFFGPMQIGDRTEPVRFPSGKWYIFKLEEKRLQTENLTLESQGVRQQITQALTNQRKEILNAALLEVALSEAKVVNQFAANMLSNPANLGGMRPASAAAAKPGSTPAPASSTTASPAAGKSSPAKK
ncbi:MAG TPA: SurA N-terminal domain-containing protein [Pyrinomonadaceae bacterium]|nr:SurA N-terminal domain-containing protein [Pyrinomonadaceae bacterium]